MTRTPGPTYPIKPPMSWPHDSWSNGWAEMPESWCEKKKKKERIMHIATYKYVDLSNASPPAENKNARDGNRDKEKGENNAKTGGKKGGISSIRTTPTTMRSPDPPKSYLLCVKITMTSMDHITSSPQTQPSRHQQAPSLSLPLSDPQTP